jgi:hypothetical protein
MKILFILIILIILPFSASAEKRRANSEDLVLASPNKGWSELPPKLGGNQSSVVYQILTWVPNRILDLIDVFKFDIGIGPALGGKITITESFQMGARIFTPSSLRLGNFGRKSPIILEKSSEYGISPFFKESKQRLKCSYQLGVGIELIIIGVNLELCPTELIDFIGGTFLVDSEGDDI